MILSSFTYKTPEWSLSKINPLKPTNLLVGKNASGKTRTINALKNVTSFLQMKSRDLFLEDDFAAKLTFTKPDGETWHMTYSFAIADKEIIFEKLTVCDVDLLQRNTTSSTTILKGESINPPKDKLVAQVRRDSVAYPEFEALMEWAETTVIISCSNLNPFTNLNVPSHYINPVSLSDMVESLSENEKKAVIDNAQKLGYDLEDIYTIQAGELKFVLVKEKDLKNDIVDFKLSSGMLRVLYLLCFMSYMKQHDKYSLLLIDDLGEGLDYRRATMLGKIIFDDCAQNGVQLIASSNDSFLMDVVDISDWQILRRESSNIKTLNETNSPDLFDGFRMTGLSNFDLFSSDFIDTFLAQNKK